jgi:NDP-sugar pyrophosphorylase family protein
MKAMLLAAGYGTRLRPVTNMMPKPMVPVANRPLIGWAVDSLLHAGVRELIVNLHHMPEAIESWLAATYDAEFHFSFEPEILGSGGGIKRVQPLLENETEFFAVNADTIQIPNYGELQAVRHEVDALASLLLRHPPPNDRFTPVWANRNVITGFGTGTGDALMFSGAQCLSPRVFRYLPEGFSGIVDDVYKPQLKNETIAALVDDDEVWFDVGTPQRYAGACRGMLDLTLRGEVDVADGSRIDGDSIVHETSRGRGSRSTIGARSVIEGAVRDSFVWDDCVISRGVTLDGCVVAHGVELTHGELRDQLICRDETGSIVILPL